MPKSLLLLLWEAKQQPFKYQFSSHPIIGYINSFPSYRICFTSKDSQPANSTPLELVRLNM
jgi:hypothetical protein